MCIASKPVVFWYANIFRACAIYGSLFFSLLRLHFTISLSLSHTHRHRKSGGNNKLVEIMLKRVKNFVGYPDSTVDKIRQEFDGTGNGGVDELLLTELEHYGLGTERTREEYFKFANLQIDTEHDAVDCKNHFNLKDQL